jgi:excisionase family DNA binding protein
MTERRTQSRRRALLGNGTASLHPPADSSETTRSHSFGVDDRLLDKDAAAAFLGVAPRTLYKWAAQGRLPVVRLGRAVRFRVSALRMLVATHEEPATRPLAGAFAGAGTERALPTLP